MRRERKSLLRRLARRLLPRALGIDRKQGLLIPLATWFRGDWGRYLQDVLRGAPPEPLDPCAVDRLCSGQRRAFNNGQRLFALAMLELWRREYDVEVPGVHAAAVGR
jgi:asparagine synthase (glutamine-hydrolysing)